ncbi:hypothetical protein OAN61_00285 [bacterium]|nr:hypothetical protein [bacterium]
MHKRTNLKKEQMRSYSMSFLKFNDDEYTHAAYLPPAAPSSKALGTTSARPSVTFVAHRAATLSAWARCAQNTMRSRLSLGASPCRNTAHGALAGASHRKTPPENPMQESIDRVAATAAIRTGSALEQQ